MTFLTPTAAYLRQTLRYRHFWMHLAFADLRARFRRSYLGVLWLTLQPLLLTIIMSTVFIFVFRQKMADYSVYLFSGLITWEFITGSFNIGSGSFISAEGYVRQVRLPMIIYPLKSAIYCCIVFAASFAGFTLYTAVVKPEIFSWRWIYAAPFFAALIFFGAPLTIISAIINMKFRDFQQGISLALQMLLYLSPVMFLRSVFDHPVLREWTAVNPVAALMDVLRDPLINSTDPVLSSYLTILLWALCFWAIALWMLVRNERKIVFYY